MKIIDVEVTGVIRLGQFLKLANMAEDGASAREFIQGGDVLVNDEVETRRGRQLADGDIVECQSVGGAAKARVKVV